MQVPYQVYQDLQQAFELLDYSTPLFADTETCGFYQKVRLLQVYQPHLDHVLLIEWPDELLMAAMLDKFKSVWHNAHYDITTVQQQTETRWAPKQFEDTFLLARLHFYLKEKFSLDETFQYVLGYCPYGRQNLDKKKLQKSNWDTPKLSQDQLAYAATDVYFMPQLWDEVSYKIEDISYKLDLHALRYALDFQWNGMPTSPQNLHDRWEVNEAALAKVRSHLPADFNANSWQQVRKLLDVTESDDLALAGFQMAGEVRAGYIRKIRKLVKQQSFVKKYANNFAERIYGKFLPSARSGRFTSKDENLQQIPRKLKGMFEAPEGRALWYADYAQLELRTICAITACRKMEELFRAEEDLHNYTNDMVFGTEEVLAKKMLDIAFSRRDVVTADERKQIEKQAHKQYTANRDKSKWYNFLLLYGGGYNMLYSTMLAKADIVLEERQGKRDIRRWQNLWTEIYAWQQKGISMWRKGKPGSTPLGRKYKAKMMTDQLNIENQGAGAEVAKLAMHYMAPRLKEYGYGFQIDNFVHDSFIVEGPNEEQHYEPVAAIIADAMQQAWFEMSKLFKIKDLPMPVDVKVGTNWGDIENDDTPNLYDYNLEGMTHYANI